MSGNNFKEFCTDFPSGPSQAMIREQKFHALDIAVQQFQPTANLQGFSLCSPRQE
jgi:hypothetical protein